MMNAGLGASSEYSSGCESGWTLYLDHSTTNSSAGYKNSGFHKTHLPKMEGFENQDHKNVFYDEEDDGDEEDLSMVSDASSGPPHFDQDIDDGEEEDNMFCSYNNNNNNNGGRLRKQRSRSCAQTQCCRSSNKGEDFGTLDDTASSAAFPSKKNGGVRVERLIDYSSQGYSATHSQGRSSNFEGRYGGYVQPPYSAERFRQHNRLS